MRHANSANSLKKQEVGVSYVQSVGRVLSARAGTWALPTDQQFSVDPEATLLISEFELDRLLETHDAGVAPGQVTAGYRWYAQYGCLTLSHGQRAEHDEIARRTAYKDRLGLTLEYDVKALRARALPFDALPPAGQAAGQQVATPQHALF
ncbi:MULTISPECIES: hypothetical protein [Cupriavidus]|uniref:hypothetical protein n=1 Tax=Cupriavidus TaxID=106589 RepID=UPI0015F3D23F|nr:MULTISPECIES: hypothetical protein [Cupriavidus]QYY34137.1 hypothetical protein K2O51_32750 [Cupriavidus pinatubonensis]